MTTLTKSTGTVTLSGTAEKVTLPAAYGWVWLKNMSDADMFAGLSADISEGADGVMVIPSGECGRIQTDGFNSIYLMGTGNALVVAQNYADCPFKVGGKGGEIPDLSAYAKTADVPNIKVNSAVDADHAANAGNAEKLGGKDASAYSTSIIKSVTFSAATADGYVWTGIPFPKYVIGVDLEHLDVIAQFYKGSNEATARAEWAMMFFSRRDVTTPLNGSFNGRIYYVD